jgi:hypothetical protein
MIERCKSYSPFFSQATLIPPQQRSPYHLYGEQGGIDQVGSVSMLMDAGAALGKPVEVHSGVDINAWSRYGCCIRL